MTKLNRLALALLAALSLTGCMTITDAPAGPLKVGAAKVDLGREWSNLNAVMLSRHDKVTVLSIDGPLLNQLYISDALVPGEGLVKTLTKEKPAPALKAGLSNAERIEFVADSISALSYQRVQTEKPRPGSYGGHPGVRFDIKASTVDGLDIVGTALIAEVDGKTYLILYLAPSEHYFQANLADVEHVMASATIAG